MTFNVDFVFNNARTRTVKSHTMSGNIMASKKIEGRWMSSILRQEAGGAAWGIEASAVLSPRG